MFRIFLISMILFNSAHTIELNSNVENRVKVAVIDTGLNLKDSRFKDVLCKDGHKDFTDTVIDDRHGHGTHVAGLIKMNASSDKYCLLILKYWKDDSNPFINTSRSITAWKYAIDQGAKIINYSSGGDIFSKLEYTLIESNPDVLFIVAAGNDNEMLNSFYKYYPASYNLPNIIVVGSVDDKGNKANFSNYGKRVNFVDRGVDVKSYNIGDGFIRMSGTSMSTAIVTGKFINKYVNR